MKSFKAFLNRTIALLTFILIANSLFAQNTTVWKRHAIDNTLKGADGARFEDANGDGLADIVTGWEQSGLVRVYFNPGKEQVKSMWKYVTAGVAQNVEDAVLVDLDGDGSLDVVSSSEIPRGVKWLENPGIEKVNGAWKNHLVGDSTQIVKFMDLNDLDSDGREDALVVTQEDGIYFYRKLSDNGLEWKKYKIEYPANVGGGKAITVADVDRDGKKDLVISCEGAKGGKSGVYYLRYKNSVFDSQWQRNEISGPEGIKYDMVPGFDFDQDGDLDFISTEENNNSAGGNGGLGIVWYENPLKK